MRARHVTALAFVILFSKMVISNVRGGWCARVQFWRCFLTFSFQELWLTLHHQLSTHAHQVAGTKDDCERIIKVAGLKNYAFGKDKVGEDEFLCCVQALPSQPSYC